MKNKKYYFFLILFVFFFSLLFNLIFYYILKDLYTSSEVIIPYGLHPFDICSINPSLWNCCKVSYFIFSSISLIIIGKTCFSFLFKLYLQKHISKVYSAPQADISNNSLSLLVGYTLNRSPIFIPEKGLFQNILITGTIGTGKTSSAIYPFTEQLISYQSSVSYKKLGMLILDVKGNYFTQVQKYAIQSQREKDLVVVELGSSFHYNPLDKPELKPSIIANRLKTILTLFSPNNSDSFWLDKVEQVLEECIKFCRLYQDGYVTFEEIHKLVTIPNYYQTKLDFITNLFQSNFYSKSQLYDLNTSLHFFDKEFSMLDERTLSIIKAEITRITGTFISDYEILKTFSPKKEDITFSGFQDVIQQGKIVVLHMNIAEFQNLSKIIAAYLKLDFQTEVMKNLGVKNKVKPCAFICDEYSEYATSTDANFFSQSRESKCINIISTQSYTSLFQALNNTYSAKIIIQNLVNKLWFRTDDISTIEDIQKQIGKEEKEKISKNISENAKETNYNYLFHSFLSQSSNLSESINSYFQTDFVYDTNYFTQNLETFTCIAFLSDGNSIISPQKLKLIPYFKTYKEVFP